MTSTARHVIIKQLEMIGHFDDEPIESLRDLLSESIEQRLSALGNGANCSKTKARCSLAERRAQAWFADDEICFLEETQETADLLSIAALYVRLEILLKRMCTIAIPRTDPNNISNFPLLLTCLRSAGVNARLLPEFQGIDELRLLNNSIKHEGKVGRGLSKFGWTTGDPIRGISDCYPRFKYSCEVFVDALREALVRAQR